MSERMIDHETRARSDFRCLFCGGPLRIEEVRQFDGEPFPEPEYIAQCPRCRVGWSKKVATGEAGITL